MNLLERLEFKDKIIIKINIIDEKHASFNFKLTFNKNIDAASLDTALIELVVENSPFDDEEQASVPLVVDSSVNGKVLTLTIR